MGTIIIDNCCDKPPTVYEGCDNSCDVNCRDCLEMIRCEVCGRVIHEYSAEAIAEWNDGGNDG